MDNWNIPGYLVVHLVLNQKGPCHVKSIKKIEICKTVFDYDEIWYVGL